MDPGLGCSRVEVANELFNCRAKGKAEAHIGRRSMQAVAEKTSQKADATNGLLTANHPL